MKIVAALVIAVVANVASANGRMTTYQTLPNSTIRDYRAPAYVTKGGTTYQTLPNSTVRDYTAPAYVSIKGKK